MAVVNFLLLVLLSFGWGKPLTFAINWVAAHAIPKPYISALRKVFLACVPLVPLLIVGGLGFFGPRLVLTNRWDLLPGWAYLPLAVGAAGVVWWIVSIAVYHTRRPPASELESSAVRLDIAARLTPPLIHPGPHARMGRWPFNDQFLLEVTTACYAVPGLPAAFDGLSIVHLSDTHFRGAVHVDYFEQVFEEARKLAPDLYVFAGDVLDEPTKTAWIPRTFGRLSAPLGCYFVLGNHDWTYGEDPARRAMLDAGWEETAGRTITREREGARFHLLGSERPWMGDRPPLPEASPEAFRLLMSHSPDDIGWAVRHRIDVMLAGHTHGGQIRLPLLGPVMSPSRYGCRFASGVFQFDPTLMIVSRGISGREPYRYQCPPQIAKIVLQSGGGEC